MLELITENTFYEFSLILLLAVMMGGIGLVFRQPLIVVFIAVGIVVGPSVLNLVQSKEKIHLLAEIGISILLFIVGIKLDFRIIKSVGKVALLTGIGQVVFTSVIGYVIAILLGFEPLHSFYIAVALTFSSTIIIVKLLSDKREIDSLHGQIAVGFLIVQDIVVILVMIVLSSIRQHNGSFSWDTYLTPMLSGVALLAITFAMARWILPLIGNYLAKSQELLILFAVGWAMALTTFGKVTGFSGEVGAFLAGVSLASFAYKDVISGRLISLRDFLLLFFFISLGADIDLGVIGNIISPSLVFSVFVLVGNPIIVLIIMGIMGYRKRTSFLAGLTVAQISEFSLIFAGLGLSLGHINEDILGLITLVGLITIGLSTYLILYSHSIYKALAPVLQIFEKKSAGLKSEYAEDAGFKADVILVGYGRFGRKLASMLDAHKDIQYVVVDFDPAKISKLKKLDKHVVYGDIEDPDLLERIPYAYSKMVICAVPEFHLNKNLTEALKRNGYAGSIFLTSIHEKDYPMLQHCGADVVLKPHEMAASNFYNQYLVGKIVRI